MFTRSGFSAAKSFLAWRGRQLAAVNVLVVVAMAMGSTLSCPVARGAAPRVTFDATALAACRDVTPDDFAAQHPGCKLVEARFQVSVRIEEGRGDDVATVSVEFSSPEGRFRVFSYDPQTWWVSDALGPVDVTTQRETAAAAQAEVRASIKADVGPAEGELQPNLGRTSSQRMQVQEHYSRRPDSQRVLVTGTTDAEHGVFFRWRRSEEATLEGRFDYSCRLIVPTAWRADWAAIHCTAESETSTWLGSKRLTCGETKQVVALYAAGDAKARRRAEQLAETARGVTHASRSGRGGDATRHTTLRPVTGDESSSSHWLAELTRWLHR
ncbi:MAG: hypothetical protein K2Y37_23480 [Pirellulales bacterium]|nr:hypothetical protein [Pirellulales bacterium]